MPELPEVETIKKDLSRRILNKKIVQVVLSSKAMVKGSRSAFKKVLEGGKLVKIERIGKLLIFVLADKKHFLLIHLKMTGQLVYQRGKKLIAGGHPVPPLDSEPNKFTRATFVFADKSKLFFNDMRRFGYLRIADKKELEKVRSEFGIEPLTKDFRLANFKKTLGKRKAPVKAVLMNQKLFAGIGNIYADEACFAAGIKPTRKVSSLSPAEIKKLHSSIQRVMRLAVAKRGTTFNDYVDADGNTGYFASFLKVYGRGGLNCKKCKKNKIKKIKMGGRGTHYCSSCQV